MEHRQLTGVAEDDVEADGENTEDEREDQDREQNFILAGQRNEIERQQQQYRSHFCPPNRPLGRNNRMATRNTKP